MGEGRHLVRLAMHLGRAALIFWVAAVLLPAAVVESRTVARHSSAQSALTGVSASATTGLGRLAGVTAGVEGAEDDVRRVVSRLRLETGRFIAQLP